VPLIGNKSALQLTLERVSPSSQTVICEALDEYRFLVAEAMQAAKVRSCWNPWRATLPKSWPSARWPKKEDQLLFCSLGHNIHYADDLAQVVKQGAYTAYADDIFTREIA